MLYFPTLVYISQVLGSTLVVLPSLLKIAKLVYPLGLRIIRAFILFGEIVHLFGWIDYFKYVFVFNILNHIQKLRIFFLILYTLINTICFFDKNMDTIIFLFFTNEFDWHTVIMDSVSGSGSGSGSGGNKLPDGGGNNGNNSGGPNPNDTWRPYNYEHQPKEKGGRYTSTYIQPSTVLPNYNPVEDTPPKTDRQLSVLLDYRFNTRVKQLGYLNWNVENAFPSGSLTDQIAKKMLFNHIFDHKTDIPTAYKQINVSLDDTPWDNVQITSYLINSLNRSNK